MSVASLAENVGAFKSGLRLSPNAKNPEEAVPMQKWQAELGRQQLLLAPTTDIEACPFRQTLISHVRTVIEGFSMFRLACSRSEANLGSANCSPEQSDHKMPSSFAAPS